ncbi:hypothetical protein GOV11_01720 [Candidatus Woesearchaeota archaeon]|nr:hypothetical protein [Candidatus Woesearchaeota archaeon]
MVEHSNKLLAMLLLVSLVVSIGGTMLSLNKISNLGITGRAGDNLSTGYSNFSIISSLSIRFINNAVDFGTGYVNGSFTSCVMGTNGSVPGTDGSGCVGFQTGSNLSIENDGNLIANVSLNFSENATGFIGGSTVAPELMYQVWQTEEPGSCSGGLKNGSIMTDVTAVPEQTPNGARVCDNLVVATTDQFEVGIWIRIPDDSAQTEHIVDIWALGCNDLSC